MIFIFFSSLGVFKKTIATNTSKLLHPMTSSLLSNNLYWQRQHQTTPRQRSQIQPYHNLDMLLYTMNS